MIRITFASVRLAVIVLAAQSASAGTPSPASHSSDASKVAVAMQNAKISSQEEHRSLSGEISASTSAMDADLVDRIRRNVVTDRNLSSYASKVTIVSTDGAVRLSGLVQNEGEKAQIAAKAAALARNRQVINDLRVMQNVPDGAALRALLEQASVPRTAIAAVAAAN